MVAFVDTDVPLKVRPKRAERARQFRALGLVAPLLLFLAFTFLAPIGGMLWRAIEDKDLSRSMPRTLAALASWNGGEVPGEDAFAALAADLRRARADGTVTAPAKRLNYDINGFRSLVVNTARALKEAPAEGQAKATLLSINAEWGKRETWAAIQRARGPVTDFYLLAALDYHRDVDGHIIRAPEETAIYVDVFLCTFEIGLGVTALCLALAFPLAWLLANLPSKTANLLMILVLLPFWTSLLVRTAAWIVLLQNEGLINGAMLWLGVIDQPVRMIYNRVGVFVAMTHVLLPFMILPLYSVMKSISPAFVRAATSLGASPVTAFIRIYLPQTLPGVGAGCLLVFILAIGYYITPALVGGAADQMISYFIAFYVTDTVNWGMAAALGAVLLVATLILAGVYARLVNAKPTTGGLK